MKKNTESIFFQTIGLVAILIIVIGGYSLYTDKQTKKNDNDSGMNKSPIIEKINVIGTYKVKKDKNSKLIIKEHGEYELPRSRGVAGKQRNRQSRHDHRHRLLQYEH